MSFQHFRLNENTMIQTHPAVHLMSQVGSTSAQDFTGHVQNSDNLVPNGHSSGSPDANKPPYGSGDTDDGYTLVFPNIDAFNEWRNKEEEQQIVEFVKGDTHGSKAVPPRFKDHTKLVCARHSRSGRKKYVKKHPERVRKVPSRKLDGQGCPASISFKTYFDTDEVRACYIAQHSHEIGMANLPFTRRGRKAAVLNEKDRSKKQIKFVDSNPSPETASTSQQSIAGPSSAPNQTFTMMPPPLNQQPTFSQHPPAHPFIHYGLAPPQPPPPPPPQFVPAPQAQNNAVLAGRWDNLSTLFETVRTNARSFEYPAGSVAALETVLIRLYLESPVQNGAMMPAPQPSQQQQIQQPQPAQNPDQSMSASSSQESDGSM